MKIFATVTFACLLAAALGQKKPLQCPNTDIILLIDVCENGRNAASPSWDEKPFQYLKDALRAFFAEVPENVLIGAYTYSSSSEQVAIIPEGSTASQSLEYIDNIGTGLNGGSWTSRGLERIQSRPRSTNNRIIVVSSQGSVGNPERLRKAKEEADRIRELGWNISVIGIQGRNRFDVEELTYVNGNKKFTIVKDESKADPKSYKLLAPQLINLLKEICGN